MDGQSNSLYYYGLWRSWLCVYVHRWRGSVQRCCLTVTSRAILSTAVEVNGSALFWQRLVSVTPSTPGSRAKAVKTSGDFICCQDSKRASFLEQNRIKCLSHVPLPCLFKIQTWWSNKLFVLMKNLPQSRFGRWDLINDPF